MLSGQKNELYLTLAKWVLQIDKLDSFAVKVSHEFHEFSRIWECVKLLILYYLTNFHLTVNYLVNIL